ncbi:hypothetical protein PFICI_14495 [Pestalotiopsis fici W106-1]|uniref:Rhodopsin domain-containing protein n=1 Tax=Pestalotiopsis fici (strain W106-1 / CGMCC3.15140) TaxID=1229662 RepID=W3WIE1_PESFW|nr:uncharacterized protein PFICI_14495 [Pestalotiopsis fici W106-1]ETS73549.1 hypothetical protein PFICI_14495 [Pestalotiopsis fici W106-1]
MQTNVLLGLPLALTGISIIMVSLRLYVRRAGKLGWEDWIMLLALIFQVIRRTLATLSTMYELRNAPTDQEFDIDFQNDLKYNFLSIPFEATVSILARLSIVILLIRLFSVHIWYRRLLISLLAVASLLTITVVPVTFFQISPAEALWEVDLPYERRWGPNVSVYWAIITQCWYFSHKS